MYNIVDVLFAISFLPLLEFSVALIPKRTPPYTNIYLPNVSERTQTALSLFKWECERNFYSTVAMPSSKDKTNTPQIFLIT